MWSQIGKIPKIVSSSASGVDHRDKGSPHESKSLCSIKEVIIRD